MKIKCNREMLSDAINKVSRAVALRSTMAALEGIYFRTEESSLYICGYNLELGISTKILANVYEEGSVVLSSKLFCEIVRKMPGDELEISCTENLITTIRSSDAGNIFIWAKGTIPGGCIALRINGTGQAARTSDDIPLEEAVNAVYVIMSGCGSAERKDIAQDCARLIGLAYDNAAQKLFDSAVTYAVRVRNLESTDSGKLRLTKNGVKRAEAILSHNIS